MQNFVRIDPRFGSLPRSHTHKNVVAIPNIAYFTCSSNKPDLSIKILAWILSFGSNGFLIKKLVIQVAGFENGPKPLRYFAL